MVISSLLGVPLADQETLRKLIDQVFHIEPGVGMINDVSLRCADRDQHLHPVAARGMPRPPARRHAHRPERRRDHRDDGVTRTLTLAEGADFANLLISAGTETVARLLGWASVVLADHPDQRAELAADSSLLPNAVEELLRYEAPSPVQGRWTTRRRRAPRRDHARQLEGVVAHGRRWTATSVRTRTPIASTSTATIDLHMSFGYGIHFCLGAALARMEGRIALEETLRAFPRVDRRPRAHGAPPHVHGARVLPGADQRLTARSERPI